MSAENNKKVILLVTSDLAKLAALETLLKKLISNVTIYHSLDASDAGLKMKNVLPHVLVTDLKNIKLNGLQFVSNVIQATAFKGVAVIIAEPPPEQEKFLDEIVTHRVQFLNQANPVNEEEFKDCLFKALNFSTVDTKTEFTTRYLKKGEMLIVEAEKADKVYIVKAGKFLAYKKSSELEVRLGEIVPGEFVGEMAYINGEPRSASVRAEEDSEVIEIPLGTFEKVLHMRPAWSRNLMKLLSRRLKSANSLK